MLIVELVGWWLPEWKLLEAVRNTWLKRMGSKLS